MSNTLGHKTIVGVGWTKENVSVEAGDISEGQFRDAVADVSGPEGIRRRRKGNRPFGTRGGHGGGASGGLRLLFRG